MSVATVDNVLRALQTEAEEAVDDLNTVEAAYYNRG
jgi:hypothetical protein